MLKNFTGVPLLLVFLRLRGTCHHFLYLNYIIKYFYLDRKSPSGLLIKWAYPAYEGITSAFALRASSDYFEALAESGR